MGGFVINNKVYFNHIPKTGGRFINTIVSNSSETVLYAVMPKEKIDLEKYNKCNVISGHLGVEPNKIFDNIETICCLRDPIARLISHYCEFTKANSDDPVKIFRSWLFDDDLDIEIKTNYQSKFFTNSRNLLNLELNPPPMKEDLNQFLRSGWGLVQDQPDYNIAKKYLERSSLILITEKLTKSIKTLCDFLKIDSYVQNNVSLINKFNNKKSETIFNNLNNDDMKKIKSLNLIDFELYQYAIERS